MKDKSTRKSLIRNKREIEKSIIRSENNLCVLQLVASIALIIVGSFIFIALYYTGNEPSILLKASIASLVAQNIVHIFSYHISRAFSVRHVSRCFILCSKEKILDDDIREYCELIDRGNATEVNMGYVSAILFLIGAALFAASVFCA